MWAGLRSPPRLQSSVSAMSAAARNLEAHRQAQEVFAGVLANVKSDQLGDPTPCPEWTVRDVLEHVVTGNQRVSETITPLPDDLDEIVAAHRTSAEASQDT